MSKRRKRAKEVAPEPHVHGEGNFTFETFRELGNWERNSLTTTKPSAFNGRVLVRRYRVTVEEIVEPDDVVFARILDLWETCGNHHDRETLQWHARRMGRDLPRERYGIRRAPS